MLTKIIAGLLIYALAVTQVVAQTAALVPNAKQTFLGTTGAPLAAGTVTMYTPNSTNKKTTWVDPNQASANTNPIVLDAAGRGIIFGQGNYRQVVKDKNGVLIWDSFTSASGSAAPSGSSGTDTAPVGSVMAFSGFVVPTNWALSYGQTLVRATYPDLLTAITISNNSITCTASSTTLTGFVSTAQIRIGAPIEGTCLPSNTTIATVAGPTSVTVNNAAVSSGVVTAVVFPWGNGDGVSTFNVPDLRGRVLPGADAMGGIAASRLTTATNTNGWGRPASSGGLETQTLGIPNLPPYTPTGTIGLGTLAGNTLFKYFNVTTIGGAGNALFDPGQSGGAGPNPITTNFTGLPTFTGVAQGGISTPLSVVQPSITINYIIKIAPNSSGAGGVVSVGGMFGDIICDATFTCAPIASINTIGLASQPTGTLLANVTGGNAQPTPFAFSLSGNTTKFATSTGTLTNGHCVSLDSVGNFIDAGGTCTTGGGGGTVSSGTIGQIAYYSSTGSAVVGLTGPWLNIGLNKTANYPIAATDCGKTLSLGGSAYYTLTFNVPSGYAAGCTVGITNKDTGRGKTIALNGGTNFILWPSQTIVVFNDNNVWKYAPPSRWLITSPITIYVDSGALDTNDCLASGSGACATSAQAMTNIARYIDNQSTITIQWGCGSPPCGYTNLPFAAQSYVGSGNIILKGDITTPSNIDMSCNIACAGSIFSFLGISGQWSVQGFKIESSFAGIGGLYANGPALITYGSMQWGSFTGGAHVGCIIQCHIDSIAGISTITGGATAHIDCEDGSICHEVNGTTDIPGVVTFTTAFLSVHGSAVIGVDVFKYSNNANAHGPQWNCTLIGLIDTSLQSANLPGNSTGNTTAGTMPTTGGSAGCLVY